MQPAPDAHRSHGREARSLRRRDVAPDRAIVLRDPGSGIRDPGSGIRDLRARSRRDDRVQTEVCIRAPALAASALALSALTVGGQETSPQLTYRTGVEMVRV